MMAYFEDHSVDGLSVEAAYKGTSYSVKNFRK